jgi:putative membrane protein
MSLKKLQLHFYEFSSNTKKKETVNFCGIILEKVMLRRVIAMKGLVIRWLLNALALLFAAWLLPGIEISGIGAVLISALVLGIVNAVIRPIVLFFTLPLNIFTLGLFTLVINALMLMLTASAVGGFKIAGFWSAFFGSIILTIASGILSAFVLDHSGKGRKHR